MRLCLSLNVIGTGGLSWCQTLKVRGGISELDKWSFDIGIYGMIPQKGRRGEGRAARLVKYPQIIHYIRDSPTVCY